MRGEAARLARGDDAFAAPSPTFLTTPRPKRMASGRLPRVSTLKFALARVDVRRQHGDAEAHALGDGLRRCARGRRGALRHLSTAVMYSTG